MVASVGGQVKVGDPPPASGSENATAPPATSTPATPNQCIVLGADHVADVVAFGLAASGWGVHRIREVSEYETANCEVFPAWPLVVATGLATPVQVCGQHSVECVLGAVRELVGE